MSLSVYKSNDGTVKNKIKSEKAARLFHSSRKYHPLSKRDGICGILVQFSVFDTRFMDRHSRYTYYTFVQGIVVGGSRMDLGSDLLASFSYIMAGRPVCAVWRVWSINSSL